MAYRVRGGGGGGGVLASTRSLLDLLKPTYSFGETSCTTRHGAAPTATRHAALQNKLENVTITNSDGKNSCRGAVVGIRGEFKKLYRRRREI